MSDCTVCEFPMKGTRIALKLTEDEKKLIDGLQVGKENEIVKNPYSGESVELCPEGVAIYDLTKGAEMLADYATVEVCLGIFLRNWPREYMVLLD
ncbi:MAG: hypothetical protein NT118_05620 [Lentisphaerae bacterium]|nr:hypothetical protein [Lentisphaerota bacterium]